MGERQGNQRGEIVEGNNNNKYVYNMVVFNCVCILFTPKYDNCSPSLPVNPQYGFAQYNEPNT